MTEHCQFSLDSPVRDRAKDQQGPAYSPRERQATLSKRDRVGRFAALRTQVAPGGRGETSAKQRSLRAGIFRSRLSAAFL